ncbi:MAG: hypothetical protein ACRDN0_05395 [Trebonia sp.]
MPVTDRQVATLLAQLASRTAEHRRLLAQLDWKSDGPGYTALLDAAFFEAADRRFNSQTTDEEIIAYVANVRSRTEETADAVDPGYAERLIAKVLGRGSIDDLEDKTATRTKHLLLAALTIDRGYDDTGLDEFLTAARKTADHWLA